MRQIDFYHLRDNNVSLSVAMLADKTVASGKKCLILTAEKYTQDISEQLWIAKPDSFLAHGINHDEGAEHAPVWISTLPELNPINASFCCLIDGYEMAEMQPFERIFNVFDGSDEHKKQYAREQWKNWNSQSEIQCRYFAQADNGSWQLKG